MALPKNCIVKIYLIKKGSIFVRYAPKPKAKKRYPSKGTGYQWTIKITKLVNIDDRTILEINGCTVVMEG